MKDSSSKDLLKLTLKGAESKVKAGESVKPETLVAICPSKSHFSPCFGKVDSIENKEGTLTLQFTECQHEMVFHQLCVQCGKRME